MAVPASKTELLGAIDKTFGRLSQELDRVPLVMVRRPVLEGHARGTTMSPADLVAYLVGWNQEVLGWHRRRAAGLADEFPARGFAWNELGALAQHYYSTHADDGWADLRTQLEDAKREIVALIDARSDQDLYGGPWYGKWTMGRMISLNTSSPYDNARRRLRTWLRTL